MLLQPIVFSMQKSCVDTYASDDWKKSNNLLITDDTLYSFESLFTRIIDIIRINTNPKHFYVEFDYCVNHKRFPLLDRRNRFVYS